MGIAAAYGCERETTRHRDRRHGEDGVRASAELSEPVRSPTIGRTTSRKAAAILSTTRHHRGEGEPAAHGDGLKASGRLAVSQRAMTSVSPAIALTGRRYGAAVLIPGAHLRPRVTTDHPLRRVGGRARAVAQIKAAVVSPAVCDTTRRQAAGVVNTVAHGGEREATRYWRWCVTIREGALSQLAVLAESPAVGRAAADQPALVQPAADRCKREPTQHRDGCAGVVCRAVANLTVAVVSPAVGRGAGNQGAAGVVEPGAHLRRIQWTDDSERHGRIAAQSGGGCGQHVAGAHEVDTEISEDHKSRLGGSRGGARKGRSGCARAARDGDGDARCRSGDRIALIVLHQNPE